MGFVAVSKDILQLNLTQAELLWLLRFLNIPDLPGIPGGLVPGEITAEAEAGALVNALQSLQINGLVRQNEDGKAAVDGGVVGILGACARANQFIFIRRFTQAGPSMVNAYLLPDLSILHEQPLAFSHRFSAVSDKAVFQGLLREQLALPRVDPLPFEEQPVTREALNAARVLLVRDKKPDAACQVLVEAGWDDDAARLFLETIDRIEAATSVTVYDAAANPPHAALIFELAVSDHAICYVLEGETLRVGSTSDEGVLTSILQFTPTLA